MDEVIQKYQFKTIEDLNWCYEKGVMYQIDMSSSVLYDKEYYEKYVGYENTTISKKLNQGRIEIVKKYCKSVLDIGIGSGEFIKNLNIKSKGFDVNPIAVIWLKNKKIYLDVYSEEINEEGITFWDSLEHIKNPSLLLNLFKKDQYVFISMPILDEIPNIKNNKHYRPNEHYYYFTEKGMINFMNDNNFESIEVSDFEIKAGRDNIKTFVFKKK